MAASKVHYSTVQHLCRTWPYLVIRSSQCTLANFPLRNLSLYLDIATDLKLDYFCLTQALDISTDLKLDYYSGVLLLLLCSTQALDHATAAPMPESYLSRVSTYAREGRNNAATLLSVLGSNTPCCLSKP